MFIPIFKTEIFQKVMVHDQYILYVKHSSSFYLQNKLSRYTVVNPLSIVKRFQSGVLKKPRKYQKNLFFSSFLSDTSVLLKK